MNDIIKSKLEEDEIEILRNSYTKIMNNFKQLAISKAELQESNDALLKQNQEQMLKIECFKKQLDARNEEFLTFWNFFHEKEGIIAAQAAEINKLRLDIDNYRTNWLYILHENEQMRRNLFIKFILKFIKL